MECNSRSGCWCFLKANTWGLVSAPAAFQQHREMKRYVLRSCDVVDRDQSRPERVRFPLFCAANPASAVAPQFVNVRVPSDLGPPRAARLSCSSRLFGRHKMASALGRAAMVGARALPGAGASRRVCVGGARARGLKTNPHVEVSQRDNTRLPTTGFLARLSSLIASVLRTNQAPLCAFSLLI